MERVNAITGSELARRSLAQSPGSLRKGLAQTDSLRRRHAQSSCTLRKRLAPLLRADYCIEPLNY